MKNTCMLVHPSRHSAAHMAAHMCMQPAYAQVRTGYASKKHSRPDVLTYRGYSVYKRVSALAYAGARAKHVCACGPETKARGRRTNDRTLNKNAMSEVKPSPSS
eukprot:1703856-Pleurochrysis_carterae.AAC.1